MATYTSNYNLEKPEASDPFGDFRQSYNDNMDIIDANLGGGGGGGGHTIVDENGSDMPAESKLQFTGNVSVTDDNVNGATVVNVSGGGGNGLIVNAQIYSDNEKVVGIWRDNKPLYQKTLFATSGLSSHMVFSHGIPDIDTLAKSECILRAYDDSYQIPITTDQANAEFEVTPTDIEIWLNNDFLNLLGNGGYAITLWYTKTTDTAGSGGYEAYGFSPVIYSDVERKIGVWRDNKPLYQRTFDLGSDLSVSYSAWISSGVTLTNVESLITAYGTRSDNSFQGYVLAWNDNTDLKLTTPRNGNNSFIRYLTLQYTKTTDVAGSGDYNTYGVPTEHYDASEQVVGTWFGKPLYQKTIVKNNVDMGNNGGNLTSIPHGVADLKECVKLEMACPKLNYITTSDITSSGGSVIATFRVDTANVFCSGGNNYFGGTADRYWYITIRYTKTTD